MRGREGAAIVYVVIVEALSCMESQPLPSKQADASIQEVVLAADGFEVLFGSGSDLAQSQRWRLSKVVCRACSRKKILCMQFDVFCCSRVL